MSANVNQKQKSNSRSESKKEKKNTRTVMIPSKKGPIIPEWHVGRKAFPCTIKPDKDLKGAIGLVLATSSEITDLVVHHPIGVTKLHPDDWVITPQSETLELLHRKENPNKQKLRDVRNHKMTDYLLRSKLLTLNEDDGLIYYAGIDDVDRKTALKALSEYPDSAHIPKSLKDYRNCEERIKRYKLLNDLQVRVEEEYPDDYTTAAGPLRDRPQKAIPGLNGLSHAQVRDELMTRIYSGYSEVEGHMSPSPTASTGVRKDPQPTTHTGHKPSIWFGSCDTGPFEESPQKACDTESSKEPSQKICMPPSPLNWAEEEVEPDQKSVKEDSTGP